MPMSHEEILDILDAIDKMNCASVEVTLGDVSIAVHRGQAPAARSAEAPQAQHMPSVHAQARANPQPSQAAPAASRAQAQPNADLAPWLEREAQGQVRIVRAPMIGTFYRAKAPGEPAFVEVGQTVSPGDTLGLMEVMKLFNSLLANAAGTVDAILAGNGDLLEFDQPVFVIRTAV
ncbi:MAG: biotin/lipoyl-containing protein [Betaproteobacteria bacterium]